MTHDRYRLPVGPLTLRLDAWTDGSGGETHLLVAARAVAALALVVRVSPERRITGVGTRIHAAEAIGSDGEALAAGVALTSLTRQIAVDLGLASADPSRLAADLHASARHDFGRNPVLDEAPPCLWLPPEEDPILRHYPCADEPEYLVRAHERTEGLAPAPPASAIDTGTLHDMPFKGDERTRLAIAEALRPWHARLARLAVPEEVAFLGAESWSPEARALYLAPGEAGRRRRQAAALQPAFVPALALDPGLLALVDAGRPFEARLLDLVRSVLPDHADRIGPGTMRSLRAYPGTPWAGPFRPMLRALAILPGHLVPRSAPAWREFRAWGGPLVFALTQDRGLEMADVVRDVPSDWSPDYLSGLAIERPATFDDSIIPGLTGLDDIADRFLDDLLPAIGLPLPRDVVRHGLDAFAWRMLYAGRSARESLALSEAWHADERFGGGMRPAVAGIGPWPALFAPFEAANGVIVRCLVTPAELAAEGSPFPDGDGAAGLAHCVGGYAHDCASGRTHVASVHRIGPDGVRERLSTASFVMTPEGLATEQHFARRNATPPGDAQAAIAELLSRIRTGAVVLAPEALRLRVPAIRGAPDAEEAETAFAAWLPYLPRRVARGGVPGLRANVEAEFARLPREAGRAA